MRWKRLTCSFVRERAARLRFVAKCKGNWLGVANTDPANCSPSRGGRAGSHEFSYHSDDSAHYLGIDAVAQPKGFRTLRQAAER